MKNNILLTIQHVAPQLSKKERLIADYVLQHDQELIAMSVHEAAEAIHVSVATVIRFCRSIGLSGYPDLKIALSAQSQSDQRALYEEIAPNDSFATLQEKLTNRFTSTLVLTNEVLEEARFKKAVSLLNEATQIVVFGLGASHIAAEDFFQKYSRIGKSVITGSDLHVISAILSADPKGKVLVLISNSGEKKEINQLHRLAEELRIPTIGITGNHDSTLAENVTVLLPYNTLEVTGPIRTAATASLIAQLYVVDLLYYYVLVQDYDAYSSSIIKTHEMTNRFFK